MSTAPAPDVDRRPVTGAMAGRVGRQHGVEALSQTVCYQMTELFDVFSDEPCAPTPEQLAALARIRAFDVPALAGTELAAAGAAAFADALAAHLRALLPGPAWTVPPEAAGSLPKHLFFEACVPAPPDDTTGAPMTLQIYGIVVEHAGARRGTPAWDRFAAQHHARVVCALESGAPLTLDARITVRIEVATYASVPRPNIGVPFYC